MKKRLKPANKSSRKLVLLSLAVIGLGGVGATVGGGENEFVYRGMIPLKAKMFGSVPAGVSNEGVEVQVAGVMIEGSRLLFGFGLSSEIKPVGVVVEDATAATAIRLVEQFPSEGVRRGEDGRWIWFGSGGERALEEEMAPWILENGVTKFVFRFFLELESGQRVEIYQPASIGEEFKVAARERISKKNIVDNPQQESSWDTDGENETQGETK